jgi:hypothetical protein
MTRKKQVDLFEVKRNDLSIHGRLESERLSLRLGLLA